MNVSKYIKNLSNTPLSCTQKKILNLQFPFYLKASAGTGKTELLIELVIKCLNDNTEASISDFVIITFTNKAASEVKNRLVKRLYFDYLLERNNLKHLTDDMKDKRNFISRTEEQKRKFVDFTSMLNIDTIHGFCEKILREYGYIIGISPKFEIDSVTWKLNDIIKEAIGEYSNNNYLTRLPEHELSKLVRRLYEDFDNKGLKVTRNDKFEINDQKFWPRFKKSFLELFFKVQERIEKYKRENDILTVNDLIKYAAELVKNDFVANKLASRYKYLFIDEFQDTNISQFELVRVLMDKGVKVFLVGDEKQSIYAFRGADIESSIKMGNIISEKCKNNPDIQMVDNFRSNRKIIDAVNKIFSEKYTAKCLSESSTEMNVEVGFTDYKPLKFPGPEERTLPKYKWKYTNERLKEAVSIEQIDIVDLIKKLKESLISIDEDHNEKRKKKEIKFSDIAVLCRYNYQVEEVAEELRKSSIPAIIYGGEGFFKCKAIISTCKLFEYIAYPSEITRSEARQTDYFSAFRSKGRRDFEKFLDDLSFFARTNTILEVLNFAIDETAIEEYYVATNRYQELYNLYKLRELVKNMGDQKFLHPVIFFEYLNTKILTEQREENADFYFQEEQDFVKVMTIHKAKGLAFDIVIIPYIEQPMLRLEKEKRKISYEKTETYLKIGFNKKELFENDSEIPEDLDYKSIYKNDIQKALEEEFRVYYVALTRAKELLILKEDTRNRWGSDVSFLSFIRQIDEGQFYKRHLELLSKNRC